MARLVDNPKGFRVIEVSLIECREVFGGYGICDFCGKAKGKGYYIAVLNSWYCPQCYDDWIKRAVRYPEDIRFEERYFNFYSKRLGL